VGGLDPDNRPIPADGLISERRWGVWQKPAGDEQQSRKRASDEDKIAGYRHPLSLLTIEQFRFSFSPHPKGRTHHWTRPCSLGEGVAKM
jgi:hypothetical protein